MKEGDVVIVAMPQADGTTKNRPAIVLREMPPFKDMLICGVSTQLNYPRTWARFIFLGLLMLYARDFERHLLSTQIH